MVFRVIDLHNKKSCSSDPITKLSQRRTHSLISIYEVYNKQAHELNRKNIESNLKTINNSINLRNLVLIFILTIHL